MLLHLFEPLLIIDIPGTPDLSMMTTATLLILQIQKAKATTKLSYLHHCELPRPLLEVDEADEADAEAAQAVEVDILLITTIY